MNTEGVAFLQNCFPSVDVSDLQEVLTRCEGDIQWATNILLDSSLEYNEPMKPQPVGPVLTSTPGRTTDRTSEPRTEAFSFHSMDSDTIPHAHVNTHDTPHTKAASYSSPTVLEGHAGQSSLNQSPTDNSRTPPSLAELCHGSLSSPQALTSPDVQNTFARGSVRRLQSIEEFRRQHSESEPPPNEKARNEGMGTPPGGSTNQQAAWPATPPRGSASQLAPSNPMSPGGTLNDEVFAMLFRQRSLRLPSQERQLSQERILEEGQQSETASAQPAENRTSPENVVRRTPSPPIGRMHIFIFVQNIFVHT